MRPICPHCGLDIVRDEPLVRGRYSMFGPAFPLCFDDRPVKLTPAQATIVWSLLKTCPDAVKRDILLERMDSEGTDNMVDVMVCNIRRKLRAVSGEDPIETVTRRGYRWKL